MCSNHPPDDRLLTIKEVLEIIPISASNWQQGVKDGYYPKSIKVGGSRFWWASAIYEFLDR